ncbi:hypothetical protein BASA81_006665 [Batrachochytrium salamandrivorans]|nr:hypothetical protein BASA81_006665 [Batrachochytrium salamandrivorans]
MGVAVRYLAASAVLSLLPMAENPAMVYSIVTLAVIGSLIHFNFGPSGEILFKDPNTGHVHPISYVVYFPFHLINLGMIHLTKLFYHRTPGSEVVPGFWLAGRHANQVERLAKFTPSKQWDCVIDLTCEFTETAQVKRMNYLNVPTWDGCPASVEEIEHCVQFCEERYGENKLILVHCAHGVGRSTLVMCAVLVRLGLQPNGQAALQHIKLSRPFARLNPGMTKRLQEWQDKYNH